LVLWLKQKQKQKAGNIQDAVTDLQDMLLQQYLVHPHQLPATLSVHSRASLYKTVLCSSYVHYTYNVSPVNFAASNLKVKAAALLISILHKIMGIRGLMQFLKTRTPQARQAPTFIRGQKWGIDISCLLFKARGAGLDILTVVAGVLIRLRQAGITPIVVFDGHAAGVAAKAATLETRRKERDAVAIELEATRVASAAAVTVKEKEACASKEAELLKKAPPVNRGDRDALKQMLYMTGTLFMVARGEADDVLATLYSSGEIQVVLTNDTDMITRGIERIVIPETADATVLSEWRLSTALTELDLSYDEFVVACVLMGSDYTTGPTFVPSRAIQMARSGELPAADSEAGKAVKLLQHHRPLEELLDEKQLGKWKAGAPSVEPDALRQLAATKGWPGSWLQTILF